MKIGHLAFQVVIHVRVQQIETNTTHFLILCGWYPWWRFNSKYHKLSAGLHWSSEWLKSKPAIGNISVKLEFPYKKHIHTHTIRVWYIYQHLLSKSMSANISYMDPMGLTRTTYNLGVSSPSQQLQLKVFFGIPEPKLMLNSGCDNFWRPKKGTSKNCKNLQALRRTSLVPWILLSWIFWKLYIDGGVIFFEDFGEWCIPPKYLLNVCFMNHCDTVDGSEIRDSSVEVGRLSCCQQYLDQVDPHRLERRFSQIGVWRNQWWNHVCEKCCI